MPSWIYVLAGALSTVAGLIYKNRAYLFALYLWRKTGDLAVLRRVAEFERAIREPATPQTPTSPASRYGTAQATKTLSTPTTTDATEQTVYCIPEISLTTGGAADLVDRCPEHRASGRLAGRCCLRPW